MVARWECCSALADVWTTGHLHLPPGSGDFGADLGPSPHSLSPSPPRKKPSLLLGYSPSSFLLPGVTPSSCVLPPSHPARELNPVQRLIQYSLRLTIHLRRTTKSFTRLLVLVSLLSASRRLLGLLELGSAFIRLSRSWRPSVLWKRDKGKGRQVDQEDRSRSLRWSVAMCFVREGLDLGSVLADNVYLFSRLRLIPLSWTTTRRADKLADATTLLSTALGLVQVAQARREVWSEGRAVRKGVVRLEERIEKAIEAEFRSETEEDELERRKEENRLRERARGERRRLRRLRGELNELWWERLRLTAEALFAGTS